MKIQCKYETWKKNAFRKNKKLKWNKNYKNALTVLIPLSSIKIIKIISFCNSYTTLGCINVGGGFCWWYVVTDNFETFVSDIGCWWPIQLNCRNFLDLVIAIHTPFVKCYWTSRVGCKLLLFQLIAWNFCAEDDWLNPGYEYWSKNYVTETLSRVG